MDDIGTHPNYDAHDGGTVPIPIIDVRTATVKYPGARLELPLTRLPPAEPPDADALRALHNAGAHLLLAAHNKVPFNKAWEQQPADIDAVIAHRRRGGAGQGGAHAQGRKGTPRTWTRSRRALVDQHHKLRQGGGPARIAGITYGVAGHLRGC